jgi:hypothetical protein
MARILNNLARNILSPVFKQKDFSLGRIFLDWQFIVGEKIGKIAKPKNIVLPSKMNKTGRIDLVCSGASSLILSYQQNYILEKINDFLGFEAIHKINFLYLQEKSYSLNKISLLNKSKSIDEVQLKSVLGSIENLESEHIKDLLASIAHHIY